MRVHGSAVADAANKLRFLESCQAFVAELIVQLCVSLSGVGVHRDHDGRPSSGVGDVVCFQCDVIVNTAIPIVATPT